LFMSALTDAAGACGDNMASNADGSDGGGFAETSGETGAGLVAREYGTLTV